MPLAIGQFLRERYRIEALIGQGGMGAVYDARDASLHIRIAIKENLVFTEAAQKQFEQEALLLAALRHPNLPRVTDHFFIPGQGQYLVMDFIEGDDLKQRLEQAGPLPAADVQGWGEAILSALAYLHRRMILHRDIKPANIKITPEGEAVLVDFGIARASAASGQTQATSSRGFTMGFTSPEQYGVGGGAVDGRADLYSLGATLYNLLTGDAPPDALTRIMKPAAHVPLSVRLPDLPPLLSAAVDRALEIDPEARFSDAEAMLTAVREGPGLLSNLATPTLPPPPTLPPSPALPETVRVQRPLDIEMVLIPEGEFLMGSDPGKDEDARHEELPQHRVFVSAFYMSRHLITNAQYGAFLQATGRRASYPPDKAQHPVVFTRWKDAVAFCDWLSQGSGRKFRLPTEAEWEKAARGADGRVFAWGNEWSERRLNNSEKRGFTTPVGQYSPRGDSPYGLTDMLGNVWEWCADPYDPAAYQRRPAGARDPRPEGPAEFRVVKGGTWLSSARAPRCAQRRKSQTDVGQDFLGFRVVMEAQA